MERIEHMDHEQNPRVGAGDTAQRRTLGWVGVGGDPCAGLVGGYLVLRHVPTNGYAQPLEENLPREMRQWPRPDLVLVVSGQMHGYIGPCGCSHPQYGGLVRRYNFVELLKQKGWPVVGLDLGELPQTEGLPRQALLKHQLSMNALNLMGYKAVGIGKNELALQLTDVLSYYSANHPLPRPLAVNLADAAGEKEIYYQLNARPWEILATPGPRLGVFSLIGRDLKKEFKGEKFLHTGAALDKALRAFAAGAVDMGVVMYHEYPVPSRDELDKPNFNRAKWVEEERHKHVAECIGYCDAAHRQDPRVPPIGLVLNLTDEPEPPAQLIEIKNSTAKILEIGHKGRFVGVVGVYRKDQGFDLKYQLVSMDPIYDRPVDPKGKNPVLDLMEQYARQVERDNLLAKVPRTPHHTQIDAQLLKRGIHAKFVGSEVCAGCHQHAATVWEASQHAKAFEGLAAAKAPSHRQFDPECVKCHTVGFNHPTGYFDPPQASKMAAHNAKFANVGCESCHGPGSAHANNPNDASLYHLINPFRASETERKAAKLAQDPTVPAAQKQQAVTLKQRLEDQRMLHLDFFCQKCHDTDNDVNWSKVNFMQKWLGSGIVHMNPAGAGKQAARNGANKDVPLIQKK
jgi:hypothetical protein